MATINSGSIGGMYLQIDYTITPNASNNTSTVRATLKLVNHYALYMTTMGGSYLSVGGQKVDYSKTINYTSSSATTTTTLYGPRDFIISHNGDGTASCNLTGTFVMNGTYRGSSVGTMTVSQTISLPKIARSSSFTVSSSVNTGSAISGTVSPSSAAFNHKILLKVGTTTKSTITMPVGTTAFSQTIGHDWFPTSTSGTISAVLETYNGTTLVATTSKNITANVPSNIVPTITSVTTSVVNGKNGRYVEGKSQVLITVNATKGSGAANIANYAFSGPNINTGDGSSYMAINSSATTYYQTSAILKYAGGGTYSVTVTDTRGRKATRTLTDVIVVQWYGEPTISTLAAQRCNADGMINENGKYAKVVVLSSYAPIDGVNTRTVVLSNSSDNYAAKTTIQPTTDTNTAYSYIYGGSFDTNKTYTIRATITDTAYGSSTTKSIELGTSARTLNILPDGTGIGVGKIAETSNLLDVAWNARIRGALSLDGSLMSQNGYTKLPNGMILQWGVITTPPNQYLTSITYPIAFPNYTRSITCQHNWDEARHIVYSVSAVSKTGFNVHSYFTDSNAVPHITCVGYWMAIGH